MIKTTIKKRLLLSILIIFSVLLFLSNVSAENSNDLSNDNLIIQDSSDIDFINPDVSDMELTTLDNYRDDSSQIINQTESLLDTKSNNQDLTNAEDDYSKENIKNPTYKSSKLGKTISVNGNSFQDIQNAINSADSGDTIYLNGNTYDGHGSDITINKPITIIGNSSSTINKHALLNAHKDSRIFNITANDVTLTNLDFILGEVRGSVGGAIDWGGSNGILKNCSFSSNTAISTYYVDSFGGAVHFSKSGKNQYVENCYFAANSAFNGAAIYMYSANSIITNCTFIENYGILGGRNSFSDGSAIALANPNQKVLNCNFFNNSNPDGTGGAIYSISKNANIFNCSFKSNSAISGGAIFYEFEITILNCSFEKNKANGDGDKVIGRGGALCGLNTNANIINSTFLENFATTGSVIYANSPLTIDACNFTKNSANSEGAVALQITGNNNYAVVRNSIFDSNYAKRYGSAIYSWANSNIEVDHCQFIKNTVDRNGGAILFDGKNCKISNSLFEHNTAKIEGGAINWRNSGDSSAITNCTFNYNSAYTAGAILWDNDESKTAIIANSTFEYNNATFAGAIGIVGNLTLIANSTFKNNKANITSLTENSQSYGKTYTFTGWENYMNAIYAADSAKVNFQNVSYWDGSLVSSDSPIKSNREAGINITMILYTYYGDILNITKATNINGEVFFDEYKSAPFGNVNYYLYVYHPDDSYYTESNIIRTSISFNPSDYTRNTLNINVADVIYGEDIVVNLSTSVSGDYTIYIANSSYDVTFTDNDVQRGNVLAYKVNVAQNELNGKIIRIPNVLNAKYGYGAYVQFSKIQDANPYMYSHNRTSFNVRPAGSSLDANGTKTLLGTDAVINYMAENGTVTVDYISEGLYVLENGTDYTFDVTDDKIIISGLDSGDYMVKLVLITDENHYPSGKDVSLRVLTPTSIEVENSVTMDPGKTYSLNPVLSPENAGTLRYQSKNENIVKVDDSGKLTAMAKGNTTVLIFFDENNNYAPSNATVTVTVNPIVDLSVNVTADKKSSKIGDTIKYTVNLINLGPSTASGIDVNGKLSSLVQFISAETSVGRYDNSTGIWHIDELSPNNPISLILNVKTIKSGKIAYELNAKSLEKDSNESNNHFDLSIDCAKISTSLTASDISTNYNVNKDLIISLKDNKNKSIAGAVVSVDLNGVKNYTTDSNGQIKVPTKGLIPKTYSAKIGFAGSDIYLNSSAVAKVTVNKLASQLYANGVTANYNDSKYLLISLKDGGNNSISGAVVSVDLNGVKNYTTDSNGQIKVPTKGLVPKNYSAKIGFAGSSIYLNSSAVAKVTVNKLSTKLYANSINASYKINKDLMITLKDINGNALSGLDVTVDLNGSKKYSTDSKGQIKVATKDLALGNYTAKINFAGNNIYDKSQAIANVLIKNRIATKIIYGDMNTGPVNTNTEGRIGNYFVVKLVDEYDNPLAGYPIRIGFNGKIYDRTSSNGVAKLQINLPREDIYTFAVCFLGDDDYLGSFEVAKITVNKKYPKPNKENENASGDAISVNKTSTRKESDIVYSDMNTKSVLSVDGRIGEYFTVKLTDINGKDLEGMPIQIGFNGKIYNRTTDSDGGAKLQINLPRATIYTFAVAFLGNEEYQGSFVVAKINVTAQTPKLTASSKTFMANAKTKSLSAKLLTAHGNPISGKKIKFTLNGKTYTGKTNSKGIATVKVSLNKKGTYSCTVKFDGMDGCNAKSTKITVKIT